MTTLAGGCHCGNVHVAFETARDPATMPIRECQCTFCRKHGSRNVTDPAGRLRITVREPDALVRYRFGLGITDFLLCRACGSYVAAVMTTDAGMLGTVNVNVLDDLALFARPAAPANFAAEGVEDRTARRVAGWTPVEMIG